MNNKTYVRVKVNPTGDYVWTNKQVSIVDVGPDRLEVIVKTIIGSQYSVNVPKITLEQGDAVLAEIDKGKVVVLKWGSRYLKVIDRLASYAGFALIGDFMGNKLILSYACTPAMINTPGVINLSDINRLENEIDNFDTGVEVIDVGSDMLLGIINNGFAPKLTDTLVSTIANTFIRSGKQVLIKWSGYVTAQHILVVGASDTYPTIAIMYTDNKNTYLITYVYGDVDNPNVVQIKEGGGGSGSITVDDALSDISTNPVQNKVINAALDGKLAKKEGLAAAAELIITQKGNGSTDTLGFSTGTTGFHMVRRDGGGQISVPLEPDANDKATSRQYVDGEIAKISGGGTSGLFLADGQFPNGLTQSTATAIVNNISAASEMPFIAISNGVDVGVVTSYKRQTNLIRFVWVNSGSKVYEYTLTATDSTYVEFTASAPTIYDINNKLDMVTTADEYNRSRVYYVNGPGTAQRMQHIGGAGGLALNNNNSMLDVPSVSVFKSHAKDTTYTPKAYVDELVAGVKLYRHVMTVHTEDFSQQFEFQVISSHPNQYTKETFDTSLLNGTTIGYIGNQVLTGYLVYASGGTFVFGKMIGETDSTSFDFADSKWTMVDNRYEL